MGLASVPRRWRVLLLGSLGLNLLVAGLALGALIDGPRRGGPPGPRGMAPLVLALPEADRAALREGAPPQGRDPRRARFDALLDTLRREPFDADAARRALAAQRALGAARMARGEAALVERLAGMGAEGRRAYADRLDRMIPRHR